MQIPSRKPADVPPPRMGALAVLPVFFQLAGKRAVVVGSSAPAAWKAELLAAAGANVAVYAPELGAEMALMLARGPSGGSVTHHARPWAVDVLAGAAIALADLETDDEARAFTCAAKAAGVPFNVIDKPAYCQFQFGAIVNRSPVVIGISTDGGAPILGQAIRRRIETLLPASIAAWGQLAKDIRESVAERIARGPLRRQFWEEFAARAFRAAPRPDETAQSGRLIADIASQRSPVQGRVTLVGAGPGDAELLTIKAVRALQAADVVLYDDLVSGDVLELARREAQRVVVGKRGGGDSCAQGDINSLMVERARAGQHVVRLKSGDPMIFGRAGEEIEALEHNGIPVEVVPGITSALAAAARLGVSLTHRDWAHSVRFVTGHGRSGALPEDLDWRGLADPSTTLVFYMGGRTAPQIAERLMDFGLPPQTPAVVIASVTGRHEERWTGEIGALAASPVMGRAPVLIGIGIVFASAQRAGSAAISEVGRAA